MSGKTVISSNELTKIPSGIIFENIEKDNDKITWKFKTEDDAYRAAIKLMNADLSYVQRV